MISHHCVHCRMIQLTLHICADKYYLQHPFVRARDRGKDFKKINVIEVVVFSRNFDYFDRTIIIKIAFGGSASMGTN